MHAIVLGPLLALPFGAPGGNSIRVDFEIRDTKGLPESSGMLTCQPQYFHKNDKLLCSATPSLGQGTWGRTASPGRRISPMTGVQLVFFSATKSLLPREIAKTRIYALEELLEMQEAAHPDQREEGKKGTALSVKRDVGSHGGAFSIPLFIKGDIEGEETKASITMTVYLKDTKLRAPGTCPIFG
ncbi:hypothetical protein BKA70DRAFT_120752 [Coprinopsis sp. MPI-PUGE-AT-0042]|nr:hypothetical protein BKA70DRAFT_120752 [Coprinopsis sp. MPI-PUGE-AT-0042]